MKVVFPAPEGPKTANKQGTSSPSSPLAAATPEMECKIWRCRPEWPCVTLQLMPSHVTI